MMYGDHGHRTTKAQYTDYGQIEERGAFFALYLPEWLDKNNQ